MLINRRAVICGAGALGMATLGQTGGRSASAQTVSPCACRSANSGSSSGWRRVAQVAVLVEE